MSLKKLSTKIYLLLIYVLLCFNASLLNTVEANEKKFNTNKPSLPIIYRLAFMTGHVEAGIELYKLNELEMAAPHLLHPISEMHVEERKGLDELGLKKIFLSKFQIL